MEVGCYSCAVKAIMDEVVSKFKELFAGVRLIALFGRIAV